MARMIGARSRIRLENCSRPLVGRSAAQGDGLLRPSIHRPPRTGTSPVIESVRSTSPLPWNGGPWDEIEMNSRQVPVASVSLRMPDLCLVRVSHRERKSTRLTIPGVAAIANDACIQLAMPRVPDGLPSVGASSDQIEVCIFDDAGRIGMALTPRQPGARTV